MNSKAEQKRAPVHSDHELWKLSSEEQKNFYNSWSRPKVKHLSLLHSDVKTVKSILRQ